MHVCMCAVFNTSNTLPNITKATLTQLVCGVHTRAVPVCLFMQDVALHGPYPVLVALTLLPPCVCQMRAMNKSYMESGGTVLSTNWEEIGKEKTPVKPPEGMEFKKWNA